jgi:hypothetical protein
LIIAAGNGDEQKSRCQQRDGGSGAEASAQVKTPPAVCLLRIVFHNSRPILCRRGVTPFEPRSSTRREKDFLTM